jgi:hypothetical protein
MSSCLIKQKNRTLCFRITNCWHVTQCHLVQRLQRPRRKLFHHANLHDFIFQKSTIPSGLLVFSRFFSLNFASQTKDTRITLKTQQSCRELQDCRPYGPGDWFRGKFLVLRLAGCRIYSRSAKQLTFRIYKYTLTFTGTCIVIYPYNESQRDALFLNFILVKSSTCFGQIYCPSSGVSILHSQQLLFVILVMLAVFQRGRDGTVNTALRLLMMDSKSVRNM